ncbi:MAG: hypothetical protein D6698_15415 [Gammaproteobacteria bacterium]|nr:MAG: hypothetical protein D6698_15415 [Gammaproteobacteria bacterium]
MKQKIIEYRGSHLVTQNETGGATITAHLSLNPKKYPEQRFIVFKGDLSIEVVTEFGSDKSNYPMVFPLHMTPYLNGLVSVKYAGTTTQDWQIPHPYYGLFCDLQRYFSALHEIRGFESGNRIRFSSLGDYTVIPKIPASDSIMVGFTDHAATIHLKYWTRHREIMLRNTVVVGINSTQQFMDFVNDLNYAAKKHVANQHLVSAISKHYDSTSRLPTYPNLSAPETFAIYSNSQHDGSAEIDNNHRLIVSTDHSSYVNAPRQSDPRFGIWDIHSDLFYKYYLVHRDDWRVTTLYINDSDSAYQITNVTPNGSIHSTLWKDMTMNLYAESPGRSIHKHHVAVGWDDIMGAMRGSSEVFGALLDDPLIAEMILEPVDAKVASILT